MLNREYPILLVPPKTCSPTIYKPTVASLMVVPVKSSWMVFVELPEFAAPSTVMWHAFVGQLSKGLLLLLLM